MLSRKRHLAYKLQLERFKNNVISGSAVLPATQAQVTKDNEFTVKLENKLRLKTIEFEKASASIVDLRQQLQLAQKAEGTVIILQEKTWVS